MIGGLSGIALNCQVTSPAAEPRTVAEPASLITNRRSSEPLALLLWPPEEGSARPPLAVTSRGIPVAGKTRGLPAGTDSGAAVCTGSPGRRPGKITGGRPV